MRKNISLIALSVAIAFVGLTAASDVLAYPAEGYRIIYYTYNETTDSYAPAGREVLACNGHHSLTGTSTDHYEEEFEDCDQSPGGDPAPCAMGSDDDVCHYYTFAYWP